MRRAAKFWAVAMGIVVAGCVAASGQTPSPVATPAGLPATTSSVPAAATQPSTAQPVTGGKLHGQVKSGTTPLPGVTVTAQNTLTGKRFSTTTDIAGSWSMSLPQNGRYVIRTQFAAFAQGTQEAVLNAASHDQTVNFELLLASRAVQQERQQEQGSQTEMAAQAIRQLAGNGAQNLSLMSALSGDIDTQATQAGTTGAAGTSGAALPSIAGNSDFGGDSVAITGQSGQVSPMAGLDMDRIRDAIETVRAQGGLPGGQGGGNFSSTGGAMAGGLFGGGGGFWRRRIWRWRWRPRQLPRFQPRPAAWGYLLVRQ
jgi:hypothetical protein